MKILITGYKGFIGHNMLEALKHEHDIILYHYGQPFPSLTGLDWVIHLGAISTTTETDVEKVLRQNYDFTCMLLVACQMEKVNLQYASSASVYGPTQEFTEDGPVFPQSPYAWSKYLFDRVSASQTYKDIVVQGFRYFNVYGDHEDHKGDQASPYTKFAKQAKEKGVIELFEGSENYLRDFIHVNEVVEIHKTFFNVKESGIWNVGTGKPRSFEAVAREVAEQYDAVIKYIPMPDNVKNQYQAYTRADVSKLRKYYNNNNTTVNN